MKKPKSVNIFGKEYSITYVDNPAEVDLYKRKSLWGQIDYWTRTIRVYDNNRNPTDIFETIIHEILHAIDSEMCLNLFSSDKDKDHEKLEIVSVSLADVLTRNGWVKIEV